ncbi:uncharacterized protein J3R85_021037 [Psidium guajava]|nr:uncharacterized protein J3R85_021037 [Psidium guajava]
MKSLSSNHNWFCLPSNAINDFSFSSLSLSLSGRLRREDSLQRHGNTIRVHNGSHYLSGAPAREPQTEACLDNTLAAHRLHGQPHTVADIQRPKITRADLYFRNQDKLMDQSHCCRSLHFLLEMVIQSNEQRRLRRIDYTRALTASMQNLGSGRAVEDADATRPFSLQRVNNADASPDLVRRALLARGQAKSSEARPPLRPITPRLALN